MMTNDLHVPVTSAALLFNKKIYTSVVHEHCLKETTNVKYYYIYVYRMWLKNES